ncbi:MAG: hypothetical protein KJZ86_24130 [Caldilineaceae bacterium]|nr:hypothetical protein [Caldilineaceae bacterium]
MKNIAVSKTRRPELQQLVLPDPFQAWLRQIAEMEDRSKSAVVRVMIANRAVELGLAGTADASELVNV